MSAERKTMSELADEYFGDISMFQVQPVAGESEQVTPKEIQETSLDDITIESPSVATPTINNSDNSEVSSPGENARERASESCGDDLQEDEEQESIQYDGCSLPNNGSIEGDSPDKQDAKTNDDAENEDGDYEEQDEINDTTESDLQDGHKERRRSSFGYCDGSVEDLSIMIFPHEAPRHRKDSLGNVIIVPNEPEVEEVVDERNTNENSSGTTRDVAVQVGDEEIGNGAHGHDENEIENIPEVEEGSEVDESWSLLEAWSTFAMIFGATPYRVARKGEESEIRSYTLSKVGWILNTIVSAIETLNVLPKTFGIFHGNSNPLAMLRLGTNFAQVLTYMAFWRAVLFKQKSILMANNRLVSSPYKLCKMSKLTTGFLLFALTLVVFANTSLYIAHRAKFHNADDFYSVKMEEIMEMFECHAQEALTWNNEHCNRSEYLSDANIAWGIVGLIIMSSSIIMQTVIVLGIVIFCTAFFLATYEIRCRQMNNENAGNIVTRGDYSELVDFAEDLSSFIGEILLAYFILHGLQTPLLLPRLFSESIVVFTSIIMSHGIIFFGLVVASLATLWMKWIWDELMRQGTRQQRPVGSARLRSFVSSEMWFKKAGIGIPGLFVINFPLMFTYIGILAPLYTVVYEMGKAK